MAQALEVVQSLEPAGVGARDLAECLKLQLVRRTPVNELAVRIVERHLDALSKSRYGLIARELKASPEEVRAACDVIPLPQPPPRNRLRRPGESNLHQPRHHRGQLPRPLRAADQ